MKPSYILAIDQGTTSSRTLIFDEKQNIIATAQKEFTQHFPADGMVEHDPEEILSSVLETCRKALDKAGIEAAQVAGIGITNQRETTIIWDRETGKPIHNAIVWQDRRTTEQCTHLKTEGYEETVQEKTGLLLDPYFSATKIAWLLNNVEGARTKTSEGKLLFGTIDCYLLWHLSGGTEHKTDATNAARTMLYNIHTGEWDSDLLALFHIPPALLPSVEDCASNFGATDPALFGSAIPILGMAGDQHAATMGQACFNPGMLKSTYGTGCFMMLNTGNSPVTSHNNLLTTLAYQLDGKPSYALEGSIFIAGAAVQWLRDGLKVIKDAPETEELAARADPTQNVILVPAFAGLGAPYWKPEARGALFGLTRASGPAEFARATLEAVCFQTRDLLEAMHKDWQNGEDQKTILRVDGGMVANSWVMQFLSDILGAPVDRPSILETTALGAAWLAGMQSGIWPNQEGFAKSWQLQQRFEPKMEENLREKRYQSWLSAVESVIGF